MLNPDLLHIMSTLYAHNDTTLTIPLLERLQRADPSLSHWQAAEQLTERYTHPSDHAPVLTLDWAYLLSFKLQDTHALKVGCPCCGRTKLTVQAVTTRNVSVTFSHGGHQIKHDPGGDLIWQDESPCRCEACQLAGPFGQFLIPMPPEVV